MPRFGTLEVAGALGAPYTPTLDPGPGPTWELRDVELVQVNWEVDDGPALELTPPALHPTIPAFASFFAGRYPTSPVGPFSLAQIRLVVRAGIRPRALTFGVVCDSPAAVEALRRHWGYPAVLGEVAFTGRHDRVEVTAAVDGRPVLDVGITGPEVIGAADLMTFDNLHLVGLGDTGEAALVQVDPEYAIHQADRGRPVLRLPDPDVFGLAGRLRLTTPIVGFAFRADTDLVPPRVRIDPLRPAVEGTTRIG